MRWLKSIAVSSLLILISTTVFAAAANWSTGYTSGISVGNYAKNILGSKDKINSRINKPMTGKNVMMQTFDNSKSFNARLSTPATDGFLEVMIAPGTTGDLSKLAVLEDLNFDNKYDYTYVAPFPVSGVCANGVISCTPGSWNACFAYKWTADNAGKASLTEVPQDELGGCYCINDSCNYKFDVFQNKDIVLKSLGTGATGAVMQAVPNLRITSANTGDMTITFYGELVKDTDFAKATANQPTSGNPPQGSSVQADYDWTAGTGNPQQYYDDKGANFALEANTVKSNSATDNSMDLYNLIAQSGPANAVHVNVYNCDIRKTVSDTIHTLTCNDIGGNIDGNRCVLQRAGGNGHNCGSWLRSYQESFYMSPQIVNTPGFKMYLDWDVDDYIKHIVVNGTTIPSSACSPGGVNFTSGNWDACRNNDYMCHNGVHATKTADLTSYLVPGNNIINWNWYCGGDGFFWSTLYTNIPKPFGTLSVSTNNSCHPATDCKLKDEQICNYDGNNCVFVFHNYNPAFKPIGSACKTITDTATHLSWKVCADGSVISYTGSSSGVLETGSNEYWDIKKTYTCKAKAYDFSNIQKRVNTINTSLNNNVDITGNLSSGLTANYTDYNNSGGNWHNQGSSVKLHGVTTSDECQYVCKVRIPAINTQATQQLTAATERGTANIQAAAKGIASNLYDYRTCNKQSNSTYVCPITSGETVVTDCQCLNNFAQAASILQAMQNAGHDLICSDGVRK